jgi:hypothetical protein
VVIGYLLVIFESRLVGHTGNIVLDTTGWVLVWVGIWFPLDNAGAGLIAKGPGTWKDRGPGVSGEPAGGRGPAWRNLRAGRH